MLGRGHLYFFTLLLISAFAPLAIHAQVSSNSTFYGHDSLPDLPGYKGVMVIPYNLTNYLSDADHDIAKFSRKELSEVQRAFRYGLDAHVNAAIMSQYSSVRILMDTVEEANEELARLYSAVRYRYKTIEEEPEIGEEPVRNILSKAFGKKQQKALEAGEESGFEDGRIKRPERTRKYMHAELKTAEVLERMEALFGTDLFVFINQLEFKTNFEHCLDRASNNFEREMKMHYTIYDVEGRQLAGDVIVLQFASNTNRQQEILSTYFPTVAGAVVNKLPRKRERLTGLPSDDSGLEPEIQPQFDEDENLVPADSPVEEELMEFEDFDEDDG